MKTSYKPPTAVRLAGWSAAIGVPALLVAAVSLQPWFDARWMFADVLTAAREAETCCHATFGFMSQMGLFLWVAAAAFALFAALILHLFGATDGQVRFMAAGGALSALLAFDDAFLLHESILPGLGVPQNLVLAAYGLLVLAYAGVFRRFLLRTEPGLLVLGGAALAGSLAVDILVETQSDSVAILEDALKFWGIAIWAAFQGLAGAALVLHAAPRRVPQSGV